MRFSYCRLQYFSAGIFIALFFSALVSCGGGTTGTGGTSSDQFVGKVLSELGEPVISATITVLETGDSAVTDPEGRFSIDTTVVAEQATILVSTSAAEASVVVDQLPSDPSVIEVSLEFNASARSAEVKEKKVRPKRKRPTPAPTPVPTIAPETEPSPEATQFADPTPVPTSDNTPDATVTPQPIEVATPTAVASVTPEPTPIALALFRGRVSVSDSSLLVGLKVGLIGQNRRVEVQSDGTFRFRGLPLDGATLVLKREDERALAVLDGVAPGAKKVVLELTLSRNPKGRLRLSVDSIQVITQIDSSGSELADG